MISAEVNLRLVAMQDNGADNVGLTFAAEDATDAPSSISLVMAIPSSERRLFESGKVYRMRLESLDTTGDEAPAGEKLAD